MGVPAEERIFHQTAMTEFLIRLSRVLGHSVVFFAREEAVGDPLGFDFTSNTGSTSGTQSSSTAFQRQGATNTGQTFQLPAWLSSLIQQSTEGGTLPAGMVDNDWQLITSLLQQDPSQGYGVSQLNQILGIDPTNFNGAPQLDNIIARNPYSQDYENATKGLYDRQFEIARANAQSGPANVRGGQARVGFDLADVGTQQSLNRFREIRNQSDKEAGIVEQAVHMGNVIESMRRSSQMQAQGLGEGSQHARTQESLGASGQVTQKRAANAALLQQAAELLGTKEQQVNENLTGKGQQIQSSQGGMSGSGWGVGGSPCCFIFLQALNGELPYYVRWGRDDFQTPYRRRGYVWMSRWLVPWMRRSVHVAIFVNCLMIRPFLIFGKVLYVSPRPLLKTFVVPVCWAWFLVWSFLGWLKRNDPTQL